MKNSYLIQTARFQDDIHQNGIDSILEFDYMGAAEFEFGALPKSLKCIREKQNEYSCHDFQIGKKTVTVLCSNDQIEHMEIFLMGLALNEVQTKEYTRFREFINSTTRTEFWWSIDRHFMFWEKNIKQEEKIVNKVINQI